MTGRDLYRLLSPAFTAVRLLLTPLPSGLSRVLYELTMWIPGLPGIAIRVPLVQRLCGSCGTNPTLHHHVIVKDWARLRLGDNVQIHPFCYLDASGELSIGNDVSVAHASSMLSFEHSWDDVSLPIKYNPLRMTPVALEDDVWVGCGVRILAGARISSRSIIAAGAVVPRGDWPSGLHAGVPARTLRSL